MNSRRPLARQPATLLTTPQQLLAALRACCLLPAEAIHRLEVADSGRPPDVRRWVEELVHTDMLTPYQAELLLDGRGADLVIGPYRILDWLGAGGMGQVYKAEHALMRRVVALKVMAAEPPREPDRRTPRRPSITFPSPLLVPRSAFLREVQAAGQLFHPNIVTAFDAAEIDDLLVLVMEYVEGVDLERLVEERGPLSPARAGEYVRQAAVGLQYAHERGLVHGDIKPSNLLVTRDAGRRARRGAGRGATGARRPALVKILDLGLARLAGRPEEDAVIVSPAPLRGRPTGLAGTPDFMAPELAHNVQQASIRSDLYSLGCTFYYLLTGQVPFPADTWTEKLFRHQFDPAPLAAKRRPNVPPQIDAVVQRLLAKDPRDRYPDPAALVEVLEDWLAVGPVHRPSPRGGVDELPFAEFARAASSEGTPEPLAGEAEPGLVESLAPLGPATCEEAETASAWEIADTATTIHDLLGRSAPESEGGSGAADQLEVVEDDPVETPPPDPPGGSAAPPAHSPPHEAPSLRRPVRFLTAALLAAGLGLGAATLLRWDLLARWNGVEVSTVPPVPFPAANPQAVRSAPARPFLNRRTGESHAFLADAIAAARNEDTLVVQGSELLPTPPLSWTGKALTLRAAPGSRPRLRYERPGGEGPFPPLLLTDRALCLEGLELEWLPEGRFADGSTHLVYCDGGPLRLLSCRLRAPRGSALIVARAGPSVELHDCQIIGAGLALSVEAGDAVPCEVRLLGNVVRVEAAGHAAVSVWAAESARPAAVRLHLEGNRVHADRVLAFRGLSSGVEVSARHNQFHFRQALLSFVAFPGPDGWQRGTVWQGEGNVYHPGGAWLQVEGVPAGPRTLEEWQSHWGGSEPGSVEKPQPLAAR